MIFLGAFLLFEAEPMLARMLLPRFGGSSAVWTTCLLFFQLGLLGGYAYARVLIVTPARVQAIAHIALLGLSLAWLPPASQIMQAPAVDGLDPVWRILLLLLRSIGLPFVLLSATTPLVQAWLARSARVAPYRLFALSNAASLLALLAYPTLVEPLLGTAQQSSSWSEAYTAFALGCAALAWRSRHAPAVTMVHADVVESPGWRAQLLWLGLSACGCLLLIAVTAQLTQTVASIPLLWVLPLCLYLLSFILCFESARWYGVRRGRGAWMALAMIGLIAMAMAQDKGFRAVGLGVLIPLFSLSLFACCMVCHGELAARRPAPQHLTSYYLMISLGGALAGIFAGVIAPRVFDGFYELPVALVLCAALMALSLRDQLRPVYGMGGVTALLLLLLIVMHQQEKPLLMQRNFYGVLAVQDVLRGPRLEPHRVLLHGSIIHGEQVLDPARAMLPTTYYAPVSGVGRAVRALQQRGPLRVGVVGLGAGTLAAYGRAGDVYRFYEINPLVGELARSRFGFLGGTAAATQIVEGDARLTLRGEAPQGYDLLAIDAFSGDAIPVHLLTLEAFQLYLAQLKPDGVLALHVTNHYLDLAPVVAAAASGLGLHGVKIVADAVPDNTVAHSVWLLLARRPEVLEAPLIREAAQPLPTGARAWTDDYSNLYRVLKWSGVS